MLREHKSAIASVAERRATSMAAGALLAGAVAEIVDGHGEKPRATAPAPQRKRLRKTREM